MILKVKTAELPKLQQKLDSGEYTMKEFQEGIAEIQCTIVKLAAEMQTVQDKVDKNARKQDKNLENSTGYKE